MGLEPVSTAPMSFRVARERSFLLVVTSGPDFGKELALHKGTYRIGRAKNSDLVLEDGKVSSEHLTVEVLADAVRLTDAGSSNGSWMGATRLTSVEATPPLTLRLGVTQLRLLPLARSAPREGSHFGRLVGSSPAMREAFTLLRALAASGNDVLLEGETGTGKELAARALHEEGERAAGPFVVLDAGSVSAALFESELFGHLRGAFTDARADRAGVFEQAHLGTLFLDEIGELPLELQPRLLRVLEARRVRRLGDGVERPINVRVVAATHRDLAADVRAGRFRADLYHRLSVATVTLPALRQRREDLPQLVESMLEQLGEPPGLLSSSTRALLQAHDWPGNVRELRNVVQRVVSLGQDWSLPTASAAPRASLRGGAFTGHERYKSARDALVDAFERDYVTALLHAWKGNVSHAAKAAGIDRAYLQRLMKKHALTTARRPERR